METWFRLAHELTIKLNKLVDSNPVPYNAKCANPSGLVIWICRSSNGEYTAVSADGDHTTTWSRIKYEDISKCFQNRKIDEKLALSWFIPWLIESWSTRDKHKYLIAFMGAIKS